MTNFEDFQIVDFYKDFESETGLNDYFGIFEEFAEIYEDYEHIEMVQGGGGEIKDLPIVFEFGLLKKHNMGGWEQNTEQADDDHFSFTFRVS